MLMNKYNTITYSIIIMIGVIFIVSEAEAIQITSPSGPTLSVDEGTTLSVELMADVAGAQWSIVSFDKYEGTRFATGQGGNGITDLSIINNRIVWTPGEEQGGSYTYASGTKHGHFTLIIEARNPNDHSDVVQATFMIIVNEANRDPELFGVKDSTTGEVGETMTIRIGGVDMDIPPQTLTWSIQVPNGATLDGTTMVWTPTSNDVGSHSINVMLSDDMGGTETMTVPITIVEPIPLLPVTNGPPYTVNEGGSKDISVKLNENPNTEVIVTLSGNLINVTPNSLTFNSNNWDTYKTITVTAPSDDNAVNEMGSVVLAYNDRTETIPVTVLDYDEMRMSFDRQWVEVTEGTPNTIQVKLTAQPVNTATINIQGQGVTVSPNTLQFAEDWNTYKPVQVSAPDDADIADGDGVIIMTLGEETEKMNVHITDDDIPKFVTSSDRLSIAEGGTGVISVQLDRSPSPLVLYAYVEAGEGITTDTSFLEFDATTWNTPQDITIESIIDADSLNTQTQLTIRMDYGSVTIPVTITDNVATSLDISPSQISLTEGDSTDVSVTLTAPPSSPIDISVSSDNTDILVSPETITFSGVGPGEFYIDIPFILKVTAERDHDAVADSGSITITATGGHSASHTIPVSVTDLDTVDLILDTSSITMLEGGTSQINISLTAQPPSNIEVTMASHNSTIRISPDQLTFTPDNWGTKSISVSSSTDSDSADLTTSMLLHVSGAVTKSITIPIEVIDINLVQMSTISYSSVSERSSSCIGVVITAAPTTPVTVSVTHSNTVTVSTSSLEFTLNDWSTEQRVCVTPVRDTDVNDGTATITLQATGGVTVTETITMDIIDSCAITSYEVPYLSDIHFSTDGTKMFVLEYRTGMIHQYALGTAFDTSTASYTGGACIIGEEPIPNTFFPSTSNLFTLGNNLGTVFEYSMTGYAITTTEHTGDSYAVGENATYHRDIFFADSGSKMYIIIDHGPILSYTLSTAYDITTASLVTRYEFDHDKKPTDIYITSDGTKMFIAGNKHSSIYQFTLSTAYDVDTASYVRSFDTGVADIRSVLFSADGTKMFILDNIAKSIKQYTLSTAYDLSTATYDDSQLITIP